MKVIITGASGMVGKGVLLECLSHAEVDEVLSIGRRSLGLEQKKLKELIHDDFSDFRTVKEKLKGYDAAYLCMGVSSAGMSEPDYRKMTYGFTIALASVLHSLNPEMTITYVSGQGTDSSEKGKSMWARVKGQTENNLLKMGFKQAFMFRPGGIIPRKGVVPSSKLYRVLIFCFGWLLYIIKAVAPNAIVNSDELGQAMIHVTLHGYSKAIIDPKDMLIMLKR